MQADVILKEPPPWMPPLSLSGGARTPLSPFTVLSRAPLQFQVAMFFVCAFALFSVCAFALFFFCVFAMFSVCAAHYLVSVEGESQECQNTSCNRQVGSEVIHFTIHTSKLPNPRYINIQFTLQYILPNFQTLDKKRLVYFTMHTSTLTIY